MTARFSLIGLLLTGILVACAPQVQTQEVLLFFYSQGDWENAYMEHPVQVGRTVPASANAMDEALKLLFAGPTADEAAKGALTSDDLKNLGPLYLGVSMQGESAVVNFKKEALEILNSAAARQFMAKEPIRRTLLQFPGVKDVQYAIDGEIFEEWDA